jgi:pimeloyl-ACP methyl ester carboxylesterase
LNYRILNTRKMPLINLPSKPEAPIAYQLFTQNADDTTSRLIVFLNGLGLPAASWIPAVNHIQESGGASVPPILLYDRFGQGETKSRDPIDQLPGKESGYGHDFLDVIKDLDELIGAVARNELKVDSSAIKTKKLQIVFVAASIGVHIARLYAQHHPGTVVGILMLDSNIGNKEYSELWPDPTSPDFDPKMVVSDDCTLEQYLTSVNKLAKMFDSDVKNSEGLDRRNLKNLLPDPSLPKLDTIDEAGLWITVVGHDPEYFAEENYRRLAVPRSLIKRFINP